MKYAHRLGRGRIALITVIASAVIAPLVAAQSTITVWIGTPPVDVCPNIPGIQVSPPAGMIIDTNGDCVTPPPPPVDVCPNIAGTQSTIPNGYYIDTNGNCSPQPTPPVDVCPNIYGLQTVVPSSLIVDGDGNCVTPPVDECPNIAGPQPVIPDGMVAQDGACITPPGTVSPPPESPVPDLPEYTPAPTQPSRSSSYTGPNYKNIPDALDPLVDPIVQAVPPALRRALQAVPRDVARTVPYYIIGVLGLLAATVAVQSIRELIAARALIVLFKRDKNIADQKDNFIALASHYLRTPLTLMRNGLDTVVALKEIDPKHLEPLRKTVAALDANIKTILQDIESNDALKGIRNPDIKTARPRVLQSGFFWIPIITSILLTWAANFLLGVVGDVDLGTSNLLFQALCLVAIVFVLYSAIRNHYLRRAQRSKQEQLVANEHAVDNARNAFIQRSTAVLQEGLSDMHVLRPILDGAPSARFFDEGYQRFAEILQKFLLLSQIQTGAATIRDDINLADTINSILDELHDAIAAKNLTITHDIPDSIVVRQNRTLFHFVLHSLIDNAIKFNNDGGSISIDTNPARHIIRVTVADNGIGIPEDKLPQLFKPFSRAGSAIEFNYEGMGFSLFLDKIITDYMGGTIKALTPDTGGTQLTVTTVKS